MFWPNVDSTWIGFSYGSRFPLTVFIAGLIQCVLETTSAGTGQFVDSRVTRWLGFKSHSSPSEGSNKSVSVASFRWTVRPADVKSSMISLEGLSEISNSYFDIVIIAWVGAPQIPFCLASRNAVRHMNDTVVDNTSTGYHESVSLLQSCRSKTMVG